jgi:hypothetical protein
LGVGPYWCDYKRKSAGAIIGGVAGAGVGAGAMCGGKNKKKVD